MTTFKKTIFALTYIVLSFCAFSDWSISSIHIDNQSIPEIGLSYWEIGVTYLGNFSDRIMNLVD